MKILDNMALNQIVPDYSTYSSVIKAYIKKRKLDEAICVLNRMKQGGVKPDLDTYAPVLEMLFEMGRVDDAKGIMDQTNEKMADD
jgi:pentatricopeptide repeat protein